MSRRITSLQNTDVAIARNIGSRYDDVKLVADNIAAVTTVADNTVEIEGVYQDIESVKLIADNLEEIINGSGNPVDIPGLEVTANIGRSNLKAQYTYNGTCTGAELKDSTDDGVYSGAVNTGYTDLPIDPQLKSGDSFFMECFDSFGSGRFIIQRLTHWGVQDRSWIRRVDTTNDNATPWLRVDATNLTATDMSSQYLYRDSIESGSLNQAFMDGTYTVVTANVTDLPPKITGNFILRVTLQGNNWQLQEAIDLLNPEIVFHRINRPLVEVPIFGEWVTAKHKGALEDKNVVFIGDSITETYAMPYHFQQETGANVSNFGIGGTRLGRHTSTGYKELSGYKIAQAISSGDWTSVVSGGASTGDVDQTVGLKDTNWDNVEYLVVGLGTNDFGGSVEIGTIADTNEYYFYAALDIMITNIISTYPHLKILWWTPIWRGKTASDPTGITGGSDVSTDANGKYLSDFVEAMKIKLKQYRQPILDLHETSGITEQTKDHYLVDLLHPTDAGAKHIAKKIASALISNF